MADHCRSAVAFLTPGVFLPGYEEPTNSKRGRCPAQACANSMRADQTNMRYSPRKRPYGYWKRRENIHAELLDFVSEHSRKAVMPTQSELIEAGRLDLAGAIRRYGSWKKVADEVGLVLSSIAKPRSLNLIFCTELKLRSGGMRPYMYWRDFDNVRSELIDVIRVLCDNKELEECGGVIPSAAQLEDAGRSDLARAIRMHGGWNAVAEKLDLGVAFRPKDYWNHFSNVEDEIRTIIKEHMPDSDPKRMPSLAMISAHGTPGLYNAVVRRFGGSAQVATRMGLVTARKPHGYWSRENLRKEVLSSVKEICEQNPDRDPSLMPSKAELRSIGRGEVYSAVERMGGIHYIAPKVGLRCEGPPPNRGNWDVLNSNRHEPRGRR